MGGGFHSRSRSINTISATRILHNAGFPNAQQSTPPTPVLDPILTDPIHSTLIYLLLKLKTQLVYRLYKPAHAVYINNLCYTGRFFIRRYS